MTHSADMNNSSCNYSVSSLQAVRNSYFAAYYVIAPLYFFLGMPGNILTLLAFYKQYKTHKAYMYQMFSAFNDVLVLLSQAAYAFGLHICSGADSNHGVLDAPGQYWYKKNYSLMWYAAHMSVPLTNAFFTISILLALSAAVDRVFAMAKPFSHRNIKHGCHQATALIASLLIGVLVNLSDCFFLRVKRDSIDANLYTISPNEGEIFRVTATLTWYLRNIVLSLGVTSLATCNGVMLYLYRERAKKGTKMKTTNAAKEIRRKEQEKTLIITTISQSFLNFVSSAALILYYVAYAYVPSFATCNSVLYSSLLDVIQPLGAVVEFYFSFVISRQFRKIIFEALECLKKDNKDTRLISLVSL